MTEPVRVGPAISVRVADHADADALSHIAGVTFTLACPPHTDQRDIDRHVAAALSPASFRRDVAHPDHTFLMAEAEAGEVVGYAMLVWGEPAPDGPSGAHPVELRRIYVAADHHGTDAAPALMAQAMHMAGERGHDVMWLGTNQLNERAIRFYEKCGFVITGHKTFTVGESVEDDFVMSRNLTPTQVLPGSATG